jgi:hypothetical protein
MFATAPISASAVGGAATGAAGDHNVLYTKFNAYEYYVIGTQTVLAPSMDTFGLNLVQTATAGQGIELCLGTTALSSNSYVIGRDAAFFMKMNFKVQDASGANPLIIGFRTAAAFNATLSSYTDFAAIGIVGTAGHIQTETQLATGGVVTTDTTQLWADGEVHMLGIYVSSTGVVSYSIDGNAPTVVAAYTFANGLTVIPFARFTEAADLTTQASSNWLEIGFQS